MRRLCLIALLISSNYAQALPPSIDGSLERLNVQEYNQKQCFQNMSEGGAVFALNVLPGIDRIQGGLRSNSHEFPWAHTAGHRGNVRHYNYIPGAIEYTDTTGPRLPIHGNNERVIEWRFPEGTIFAEELLLEDGKVFEVRVKRKRHGKWDGVRYNPWKDADDFAARLKGVWELPRPALKPFTVKDNHPFQTFKTFTAQRDDLPAMPKEVRDTVLRWPMQPRSDWRDGAHAPSTRLPGGIVPIDYEGTAFPSDNKSCMTCHEQAGVHSSAIDPRRDWYGRIRGSDGIFSFHIFDESSIVTEYTDFPMPPRLNSKLNLKRVSGWTSSQD